MHIASERRPAASRWSRPSTNEGRWAPLLAAAALALGLVGEVARGDGVAPFYRVAFLAALLAAVVALVAIRRGERSLVTLLAFVPFALALAFGAAQGLG